jgi:hypothetical protein
MAERLCCDLAPVVIYHEELFCIDHALALVGNEPAIEWNETDLLWSYA